MLVIRFEDIHAGTKRSSPAKSMQLPAKYQVSIWSGCLDTQSAMFRAPTGPIMLLPSKKWRTKVLLERLAMSLEILGGPRTLVRVNNDTG